MKQFKQSFLDNFIQRIDPSTNIIQPPMLTLNKNSYFVDLTNTGKSKKDKATKIELKRKTIHTKDYPSKRINLPIYINQPNEETETNVPIDYAFQNSEFFEPINKNAYSNYQPSKLKLGKSHSYNVVESRSLVSIESPDIHYKLSMPKNIITKGLLSNVQLEAIVYACQRHETFLENGIRAGFLIGDGAGVGKGRIIAGIIYENMLSGRNRSIWISISNDLIEDAKRDFNDIKACVCVTSLSKMSYKKNSFVKNDLILNEVLFSTYKSLIGDTKNDKNSFKCRLDQIVAWFGENYDGVIVFDECHKAKNLTAESSKCKTATYVKLLQDRLPKARIVYSSATGASEPEHMAYMVRLGLWGPKQICPNFQTFERKLKRHGVSSMELVAMDMKRKGIYIARQLSFKDIKFDVIEIQMKDEHINGHEFKTVYNKCVEIWTNLHHQFTLSCKINKATTKETSNFQKIYWAAHQRFFKYLCISGKVSACVKLVKKELAAGKCVVIGLQSTGESRINDLLSENGGELVEFVSSAKEILRSIIINHFPNVNKISKLRQKKNPRKTDSISSNDDSDYDKENNECDIELSDIQTELLKDIELIDSIFPLNTLDQLIMDLGGSDKVAEMTGRKGRIVKKPDGTITYEQRRNANVTMDQLNIDEKNQFNQGKKLIAIISDAASTGISLHSDSRFKNKRQRVHITMELPWSADKAIQQFGRTHRSNQVIPPHYMFLISDLAGERRFAATVAKRLESLGALTHGDRKAADSKDLSQFNFEHEIGYMAVKNVIKSIMNIRSSVDPVSNSDQDDHKIFKDKAKESLLKVGLNGVGDCSVAKFLNRLLGTEIDIQNQLFQYFIDTIDQSLKLAKSKEEYDHGIRDVTSDSIEVEKVDDFSDPSIDNGGKITISKVKYVNDGIQWKGVLELYNRDPINNYFCVLKGKLMDLVALVVTENGDKSPKLITPVFPEESITKDDLDNKWQKITFDEAVEIWNQLHRESEIKCLHLFMENKCLRKFCTYGKRTKFNYMITGAIFLARSFIDDSGINVKINVARLQLSEKEKLIGAFFSPNHYDKVMSILSKQYTKKDLDIEIIL